VVNGVLGPDAVGQHAPELLVALFTAAGDEPERCRASVRRGWDGPDAAAADADDR
jgi:hypothetical protein